MLEFSLVCTVEEKVDCQAEIHNFGQFLGLKHKNSTLLQVGAKVKQSDIDITPKIVPYS